MYISMRENQVKAKTLIYFILFYKDSLIKM